MACSSSGGGGGAYGVTTVDGMEPPHGNGAPLELAIITSCCCVAEIAALNSSMLLLLHCAVALLTMLKAVKPSRMVLRL